MKSIAEMSDTEVEECITSLRARRAEAELKLKAHKQALSVAKGESLRERLTRQLELAEKDYVAITKKLEKLEQRINSIAALRLQHGDLALEDLADVSVSKVREEESEDEH